LFKFIYLVEIRFNGGKIIKSDKGCKLLLNRSKNVVFIVQLFIFKQRHFPLHKSNSHKISHSVRIVTFVINQRVAIVELVAIQRIRINLNGNKKMFSLFFFTSNLL